MILFLLIQLIDLSPGINSFFNSNSKVNQQLEDPIWKNISKRYTKIKTTKITSPGMIYVPKNWPEVAINDLRNGEEGLIPVKVSKSS